MGMNPRWIALAALGAFHGINPSMGWLFAVALGMQERRTRAVWMALIPLGLGHLLAIASTLLLAVALSTLVSLASLRSLMSVVLIGFGASRLVRAWHPRWRGLHVGLAGLTGWSFLMASAHGAGLMILPLVLTPSMMPAMAGHAGHAARLSSVSGSLAATAVHGIGYLAVTACAAVVVYKTCGLALLRSAWINLDLVWAVALVATGAFSLIV